MQNFALKKTFFKKSLLKCGISCILTDKVRQMYTIIIPYVKPYISLKVHKFIVILVHSLLPTQKYFKEGSSML